jgi:molybdenum cofactor cytidylyltransferase
MSRETLPIIDPDSFPEIRERAPATTWGVLLAAGTSSRYGGENKLLATLDETPLVRHAAETLVESAVDGVTIVVGHDSERVRAVFADLPVSIRKNEAFAEGQSTSVREGVLATREHGSDAALIALGDMPRVDRQSIDLLVEAYERDVTTIAAAASVGKRGNPVLFDARFFDELVDGDGDIGGRKLLIESDEAVGIETGDPGVLRDVDRPSDLSDIS